MLPNDILNYIFTFYGENIKQACMLNKYWMYKYHIFNHQQLPYNHQIIKRLYNVNYPIETTLNKSEIIYIKCVNNYDTFNLKYLRSFTSLRTLILPNCNKRIDNNCISILTNLTELNIPKLFKCIPNICNNLVNLKKLYLDSYNENITLHNLTNLEILSLNSKMTPLQYDLLYLTNLKILSLNKYNTPLLYLPINLEKIYLKNYRQPFNKLFTELSKLKTLHIGYHKDSFNDENFMFCTMLQSLNIHLNFGKNIDENIIESLSSLITLKKLSIPYLYPYSISEDIYNIYPKLCKLNYLILTNEFKSDNDLVINDNIAKLNKLQCKKIENLDNQINI